MRDSLLSLIPARMGHFLLESGHHGGLWLDLDPIFLSPSALQPFVKELAARLLRHNASVVCGPLVGGAFLAQSLAAELDIEFYYTERSLSANHAALYPFEYRLPTSLHAHVRGKAVAIVDDVISAGSAVRGTYDALRSAGAEPACMGALLVLGASAARFCADHNIALEQLGQMEYNLWTPSKCPLCASGVPLEALANELVH